jgi:hypothetical protein
VRASPHRCPGYSLARGRSSAATARCCSPRRLAGATPGSRRGRCSAAHDAQARAGLLAQAGETRGAEHHAHRIAGGSAWVGRGEAAEGRVGVGGANLDSDRALTIWSGSSVTRSSRTCGAVATNAQPNRGHTIERPSGPSNSHPPFDRRGVSAGACSELYRNATEPPQGTLRRGDSAFRKTGLDALRRILHSPRPPVPTSPDIRI